MYNPRQAFSKTRNFVFLLTLLFVNQLAWAQGQPVIFSATGDVPYSGSEATTFQKQLTNHNLYSPSAFLVHVGDIASSGDCGEVTYSSVSNMMKGLTVPTYIVLGDNESVDCSNRAQGMNYFMQYFGNFEQNFCGTPYTEHQSERPENWAFTMNGVLFVGVNLVYGGSTALQEAAAWCTQQLQAKGSEVRAAVFFAHYTPGSSSTFSTPFRQAAAAFGKPVLFVHGHGHSWSMVYPFPEPNILRVQVNKGASEDPVEITVTMDNSSPATAFVFKRKPWGSKTIINMPPCANAGPDQEIFGSAIVNLQGQATDDGDPSGFLTTTWSKAAGPGSVTFGNASAPATTASFSAAGLYVLRLTANDGQLQNYDEVTIGVDATTNVGPVISSFSPASGNVGTVVTLNGINFTGATSVLFNDIPATSYTVSSDTKILVTVPPGATTGKIKVNNTLGAGFSSSDFVVTGVGANVITFLPTDDAHVVSTSATKNYGNATNLLLDRNSASDMVNIYLKFNVSGLTGPVQSAKLRLKCSNGSDDGGSVFSVSNDYKNTNTPWFETGLIWNNAPEITGSALSSLGTVSDGQTVELDVTAAITGEGTYSFALTTTSSNAAEYNSNEGSTSPVLSIEITPPAPVLPTITSFTPDNGPVGSEVTITGTELGNTVGVTFNGAPAAFIVDSGTQVRATVPANATTGKISIANAEGTVFSDTDFTLTAPPVITSFAPASGQEGTEVTIVGNYFNGVTAVSIKGKAAIFVIDSNSQIRAYVPAGATLGTGKIVVTSALGSATSTDNFTVTDVAPVTFSFTPQHDTYINSESPTGTSGTSSTLRAKVGVYYTYLKFEVTGLNGTLQNAKLRLHVSDASPDGGSVHVVSNNYRSSTTPWVEKDLNWNNAPDMTGPALSSTGAVSAGQWVEFDVTSAIVGNGIYSFGLKNNNSDKVYYRSKEYGASTSPQLVIESLSTAAPSITSFTPGDGPAGTEVAITGNNFLGTTAVTFNGVPATNITVESNTTLLVLVPNDATTGRIKITNASGNGSHARDFVVTTAPVITSFTPTEGAPGTEVTITGNHFTGTTKVSFNGIVATTFYLDSDTQIRAMVPSGGTIGQGKIVVTNSAGSAISANDFKINLLFAFAPAHDAYVKSSAATTNYGTSSTLRVKVSGSETFCSYLKFDVTGVSGTLRSATLRLYVSDAGPDGGSVYLVSNDYIDGSAPWTERGLLWDNAPTIAGTALGSAGNVSIGQWVEFDVTSAISGDGVYSFALKNNNSDRVYYRSKENGASTAPQLLIQASSGPSALSKGGAAAAETETIAAAIPTEFVLQQNYPNPFNPTTQIRFGLPQASHVTIKIYTINGAEVKTLVDNHYPAGMHALTFEAKNLPSGTYFYVMQAGAVRKVRQLMLLK
jgi:flagellar hook assembly protein FlgD